MAPRQSVAPPPLPAILGHLELIARKTGAKLNGFPIDAERVTFGRDEDCDVRIYVPDVSKLHAEIEFDAETGQAALTVHGANGLLHTPAGGRPTKHRAGAVLALGDGDTLLFAKKLFRFSYGPAASTSSCDTPTKTPARLPPIPGSPGEEAGTPVRRRASHRLSIVPKGRRFVPLPPRRSTLGLELPATADSDEEPESEEPVKLAGDEGDTLFVERRGDEPAPAPAFMTPQPRAEQLEPRNTSAVPRRVLRFQEPAPPTKPKEAEQVEAPRGPNEQPPAPEALEDAEEPARAESPRTPKYVPLPPPKEDATAAEAPYTTPSKTSQPQITAQVAYSTPRGDASLRKLLLLRSARKVWEESQLQRGVDGGIALGAVETRRKSFGRASSRKSSPPQPVLPDSDSSGDENDENAPPTPTRQAPPSPAKEGELKWIFEDGQGPEDSDSDGGSLSSDTSIPGQGVIDFGDLAGQSDESDEEEEGEEDEEEEEESEEEGEGEEQQQATWDNNAADASTSDMDITGVPGVFDYDESASDADISGDVDDAVPPTSPGTAPLQLTPPKACTPPRSPRGPRVSQTGLASVGGPAVRFDPAEPARPVTTGLLTPSRRGLGRPVREVAADEDALLWSPLPTPKLAFAAPEVRSNLPDFLMDDDDMPATTPLKATAVRTSTPRKARPSMPRTPEPSKPAKPAPGLTPAQRSALGTPRRLGLPAGSFARPQPSPATPHASPLKPLHPALAGSPEPERALAPGTPMEDIKRRLSALALRTATPAKARASDAAGRGSDFAAPSRRRTLDFAVPSTPVGGTARRKRLSNIFDALEEGSPTPAEAHAEAPAGGKGTPSAGEEQGTGGADALADAEEEPEPASPSHAPVRRTPRASRLSGHEAAATPRPASSDKSATPPATPPSNPATPRAAPPSKSATPRATPPSQPAGDMYDAAAAEADEADAEPATPAKRTRTKKRPSAAHTLTPDLRGLRELYRPEPPTPPTPPTPALAGIREMYATPQHSLYPDLPPTPLPSRAEAATPALTGIREMYAPPREQETPDLRGVKALYPKLPAPTPALHGIREMYAAPREQGTPALNGIREMYAEPKAVPTPALDGVKHMYAPVQPAPRLSGVREMFAEKRRAEPRVSVGDLFPEIPETAPLQPPEPEAAEEPAAEAALEAAEAPAPEEAREEAAEALAEKSEPAKSRLPRKKSASPPRARTVEVEVVVPPSASKPTRATRATSKEPASASTRRSTRAASQAPDAPRESVSRRSTRSTSAAPDDVPSKSTRSRGKTPEPAEARVVRRTRSRQVLGEAEQPKASDEPTPADPPAAKTRSAEPKAEAKSKPSRSTRAVSASKPAPAPAETSKPSRRKAAEAEEPKSTRSRSTRARATTAEAEAEAEKPKREIRKPSVRVNRKENEAPAGTVAARTRSRK